MQPALTKCEFYASLKFHDIHNLYGATLMSKSVIVLLHGVSFLPGLLQPFDSEV